MVTPAPLPSKAAPGGHGDLRLCFLKQTHTHAGVWDVASFPPTEQALGYRGAPGSGLGSRIREEPQDVADGAEPTSSPPGWIQAAPTRGPAGGSPHPGRWVGGVACPSLATQCPSGDPAAARIGPKRGCWVGSLRSTHTAAAAFVSMTFVVFTFCHLIFVPLESS